MAEDGKLQVPIPLEVIADQGAGPSGEAVDESAIDTESEGDIDGELLFRGNCDKVDGEDPSFRDPHAHDKPDPEQELLRNIEGKPFDEIEPILTAKALMVLPNPLLSAIRVTEKLHDRADLGEHDKQDFIDLSNSVEEFTLRFLDPLKHDRIIRPAFSQSPQTQHIIDTAIKLGQKKFFDHPIVVDLMLNRWYGKFRSRKGRWWLFLNLWCVFDIVLFPLMFSLDLLLGLNGYEAFFTLPYFIFVRDTLSYMALLGLHFAICLEPSNLSFSRLEWVILILFVGRFLIESRQVTDKAHVERQNSNQRQEQNVRSICSNIKTRMKKALKGYLRDRWNIFDLIILFTFFFGILPLRVFSWAMSKTVADNQVLVIAQYLYGFNTMLLTFRAFGHMSETIKGVGTIQIALFHIIREVVVVLVHFIAISLAFSSAITKVFVAESSMVKENLNGSKIRCEKTGILCWWETIVHLGWALLELSDGLDFFKSADSVSQTLAQLLFAAYLVIALILLINMLIALLSNVYQQVQDNSEKEWAIQKAITIQTYCDYHPIPVPFNIVSIPAVGIYHLLKKKRWFNRLLRNHKKQEDKENTGEDPLVAWNEVVTRLLCRYRYKYGDYFPPTCKIDQVLQEIEKNETLVNQLLHRSFQNQKGCDQAVLHTGSKLWEAQEGIRIDGLLLTCEGIKDSSYSYNTRGARYLTPFSLEFPHFEAIFLETGEMRWLGIGVVNESYDTTDMPGWYYGSVGYHTDDGKIFHNTGSGGRETKGRMARRGDRIRCTVIFDNERKNDGKVQVVFSLNDRKIMMRDGEDHIFMDYDRALYPYIGLTHGCSALTKMFANNNEAYEVSKLEDLDRKLESKDQNLDRKIEETSQNLDRKIEETNQNLDRMMAETNQNFDSKIEETNQKLDILLARLSTKTTTTAETQTEFS